MKTVRICFFWHMHQPYYTDPVTQSASMPWVRLHAIEAYYDMAFLLEQFPDVRSTFNFTPSLLLQLQELLDGSVQDFFWQHAMRPAADLSGAERAFIVRHFFAANWATMVRPYPRYHELLVKRGTDVRAQDLEHLARPFSTQELLDLQTWHNLAWFGYGTATQYPRISELRRKDRGFTEEEKQEVLALQLQAVAEIVPRYRRLAEAGQIELTTSPFYHPILPLLIDTDNARRARPDLPLPSRFHGPEDAAAQLQRAVAFHTRTFGTPPQGLWPSEGSVCPEVILLVRQAGLWWMASDEGILARSLPHWQRATDLYQPYQVGPAQDDVAMVFRDREISDAIGFVYSKNTPEAAAEDLLRRIGDIARAASGDEILLPVILDGENAWEHYYDGGQRFLSNIYRTLGASETALEGVRVTTETMGEAIRRSPGTGRIERLHSGSWINQDFKIWIGHPEDNQGWNLVRETRERLLEVESSLAPGQAEAAWEALYAAEGSDWFWWFGDDFETDFKTEFDRLFRTHLRNVFIRAGLPVPESLSQPIARQAGTSSGDVIRKPVNLLSPTIDGRVSDFFEWRGAGTIDPMPPLGAMWTARKYFSQIAFGFSLESFFLRLDPGDELRANTDALTVELEMLTEGRTFKLTFPLATAKAATFTLSVAAQGLPFKEIMSYGTIGQKEIVELAVPFKDLHLEPGQEFRISLVVRHNQIETARYPRQAPVTLTMPDDTFEATMWRV